MKKAPIDRIILYLLALVVVGMLLNTIKGQFAASKVAFIDIGKMLESYKFKKDLEAEGTKNLYKIKNTIDSLQLLQKVQANPTIDSQIVYAQRAFDQYYSYSNQEMTKKIWERLNPQLEEFGKENHYELVVGANGAGTVLYGDKKNDVTQAAVDFINQKYEKGN